MRYGFYLRPSFAMCRAQAELHDLLHRQYGLIAGGCFMPHATIKGFFESDATIEQMVAALDPVTQNHSAFPIFNSGVYPFGTSAIVLDIHRLANGLPNGPLVSFQADAVAALRPFIRPDCAFSAGERSKPFHAHLTLAMADIPKAHFDEILRFVRDAEPLGPREFTAEVFSLWSFTSDDWDGRWWESLRWKIEHSWRLTEPAPSTAL